MQWWNLKQLKARSAATRLAAVERLGREGESGLVAPLLETLSDEDAGVRAGAAAALGRIRSEQAGEALAARLAREPDGEVRKAIVKALHEIGGTKNIPALVNALGDPVGETGWLAARALQGISWQPENDMERAAWHLAVSQFDEAISLGSAAVEPLARLARGIGFHRCIRAVEALARVGGAQCVKPLLECLSNQDFTVRSAAAMALGEVGDARAVDPLIHSLRDPHHQVCLASCISLRRMGDQRAVEPLIRLLTHSAPDVRVEAVAALGKLRDARAVEPLVPVLRDSDTDVREAAATALGVIGDESAMEHLVLAMIDPQPAVRQAAASALRRIEPYWERSEAALGTIPDLQAALKHKEYWVRHCAADILKKLGVNQEDEGKLLTDSDGALQKRQAAQKILISMLADRDAEFRQAAAEALGRAGLSDCVKPLVERLRDSNRQVQKAAARALEKLRWKGDRISEKARQLVVLGKWAEAGALGAEAVEALAEAVTWNEQEARQRAIEALVHIGGARAHSALRAMAADPDADISEAAAAALEVLSATLTGVEKDSWSEVVHEG